MLIDILQIAIPFIFLISFGIGFYLGKKGKL